MQSTSILNNLRFPLAVIVVGIHVFSLVETVRSGSQSVFVEKSVFDNFLAPLAVPCFFFMSGFFFFKNYVNTWSVYKDKLHRRVCHLLIPYIIWNLFVLLKLGILFGWESAHFSPTSVLNIFVDRNFSPFGNETTSTHIYPMNIPLWYIRDLLLCVLLSPIIYTIASKMKAIFLFLIGLLFLMTSFYNGFLPQLACSVLLFCWGGHFSVCEKDFVHFFNSGYLPATIIFVSVGLIKIFGIDINMPIPLTSLTSKVQIVSGVIVLIQLSFIWGTRFKMQIPSLFTSTTYFVFLSHYLFYQESFKLLERVIPQNAYFDALTYLLGIALTYMVSVALYKLLDNYCKPILHILTGTSSLYGKH